MPRSTPDLIIRTAVRLYNRDGVRNTSIRAIADHLGISAGNLTYHFPSRRALLEGILADMASQRERRIGDVLAQAEQLTLSGYFDLLVDFARYQKRHVFFYRDVLEVFRLAPSAQRRYRTLFRRRVEQGQQMCQLFVANGILEPEAIPDQYLVLAETISSLYFGYPTTCRVLGRRYRPLTQARATLSLYYPYLTARGRREFADTVDRGGISAERRVGR